MTISQATKFLEDAFDVLNKEYFENALARPIITIQTSPRAYGHFTTREVWQDAQRKKAYHEINLGAERLDRPIANTIATLVHEMVHYYCQVNGIQDTSRGGTYHNKRFKEEAERRGLECYRTEKYGWNTRPTDRLVEYALEKGWNEIQIGRSTLPPIIRTGAGGTAQPGADTTGGKRPSSTRKLICPKCGQSVRATRRVNILCGDCMERMIEV